MPTQLARIAIVAAAALTLAACAEQDIFAPATVDSAVVAAAPGFGTIIRPIFPNPEDFMDITAGDYHTCARKYNGNVFCWGREGGPLNIVNVKSTPILTFTGALTIDAGAVHTCALNTARNAFCWGGGDKGQLGLANGQYYTSNSGLVAAPIVPPGQPAQGTLAFNNISAGGYSTCGTAPSGTYCWGELGNVTNPNTPTAAPVQIGTYNGFTSLAVGYRHACGTVSGNDSYCWGSNMSGQSGVDPAFSYFYPGTQMLIFAHNNSFGGSVYRLSTQQDFTCADKANGTVQCFGSNTYGQLGNNANGWNVATWIAQTVGGGQQLSRVSTGVEHACALDLNNAAWCWGRGLYGQLGQGASVSFASAPVPVTGGRTYKAIAAGRNHTCAIGTDNRIYCWGQNNYRQLGTWIFDANGFEVTNGFSPNPVLTM